MLDDIILPDCVFGEISEDPLQMYSKAPLMASLAWRWWTHSLASIGVKYELDDIIFSMMSMPLFGLAREMGEAGGSV